MILGFGCKRHHLTILHLCTVDGEPYDCALLLPTLTSSSTGIDVKQAQGAVVLDAQNVRMAADEELWRTLHQFAAYAGVVSTRITTNVLHQHLYLLTLEAQHFGKHASQFGTVAIAIYCT